MNGNFSLAQSLIANMGQRAPMPQGAPQGGLNVMGGMPPSKQSTDAALQQDRQDLTADMLDTSAAFGNQQ